MVPWDTVDGGSLLDGQGAWLEADHMSALARHPLECIDREFPHYQHSIESASDVERPAERHPVFYGCYDWHSAVHSHWSLLRQLRLFDDHPDGSKIRSRLEDRFTPDAIAAEVEHLEANPTFERPYGWTWFLRLVAELALAGDDQLADWRDRLRPLEAQVVELVETEFLSQDRPLRVGTHGNSAFGLAGVIDYAQITGNQPLETAAAETARSFYLADRRYPLAYEPFGWDFLSPGLVEADLLRRVLDGDAFRDWFEAFLPADEGAVHIDGLEPVAVGSHSGPALHLAGLNLSRAWCLAGIGSALSEEPAVEAFEDSAVSHARRGLEDAFTDDYAGAHWLSSYVLYLLTRNAGGIAPDWAAGDSGAATASTHQGRGCQE
ncbi:MAG: DUF2891 domain-containing protein [Halobacteriales archaeon]